MTTKSKSTQKREAIQAAPKPKFVGADGEPVRVELVGRDGNAFAVLGACRTAARKAGVAKADLDAFTAEATSGDYNHLLATAMRFFDVE